MQNKASRQGSSMAWSAVFLLTVLMPLMLLVVDGSRLLYIRGRLQTATDAACEAAAWSAGDRQNYMDSGETRIGDAWYAVEVAQSTFASTLSERSRMVFTTQLGVTLDVSSNQVFCSATAQVPVIFILPDISREVEISAETVTAVRFR